MAQLLESRCFNHASREAVACCPECSRFFCRECVTEHQNRVLCAACLRRLAQAPDSAADPRAAALRLCAGAAAGVFTLWMLFYLVGQVLLLIPSSFHEGTWWETLWQGRP